MNFGVIEASSEECGSARWDRIRGGTIAAPGHASPATNLNFPLEMEGPPEAAAASGVTGTGAGTEKLFSLPESGKENETPFAENAPFRLSGLSQVARNLEIHKFSRIKWFKIIINSDVNNISFPKCHSHESQDLFHELKQTINFHFGKFLIQKIAGLPLYLSPLLPRARLVP